MRRVEGHVEQLRCGSCEGEFSTFIFSGDSDMVTAGLETATAPETGCIAIGERLPSEMQDHSGGCRQFAERVSEDLGAEFRPVPLLRVEQPTGALASDFGTFRRSYKSPERVYGCPRCGGEARVMRRETPGDFIMHGGTILSVGVSLAPS